MSTKVMLSSTGEGMQAASKRCRNALPNCCSARNCLVGSCARALPGVDWSCGPCMTATKRSVVGSGPIRIPGKSLSSRYLMKVVLPVEYWPIRSTMGLASKSPSLMYGEWKEPNW